MNPLSARLAGLGAAALLMWLFNHLLDPVPVAAGPAFAAGALVLLAWPARPVAYGLSASVAGALVGIAIHRGWHTSGQSPEPAEGLLAHLLSEGLSGLAAAIACLLVMKWVSGWLSTRKK